MFNLIAVLCIFFVVGSLAAWLLDVALLSIDQYLILKKRDKND